MLDKQKLNNVKNRIVALYSERPIEMLAITIGVVTATSKLIHSVSEAQNAVTWRREVERRRVKTSRMN